MDTITADSLHENLTFTGDLMIDSTFVLLPQTAPVTNELIKALREWEFDSFYCEGNLSLGGDIGISVSTGVEDKKEDANAPKMGESLKAAIERSKNIPLDNSDKSRMDMVQKVYEEYARRLIQRVRLKAAAEGAGARLVADAPEGVEQQHVRPPIGRIHRIDIRRPFQDTALSGIFPGADGLHMAVGIVHVQDGKARGVRLFPAVAAQNAQSKEDHERAKIS